MQSKPFKHLQFLLRVLLTGIGFFTIFRIMLLLTNYSHAAELPDKTSLLVQSFLMGFRFDVVISCYIILLPLVVLSVSAIFRANNLLLQKIVTFYILILYAGAFLICAADVPYFHQFFNRINSSIFLWIGDADFAAKMIIQEKGYIFYLLVYITVVLCFVYCLRRIARTHLYQTLHADFNLSKAKYAVLMTIMMVVLVPLCILGMRGRLAEKSPIVVGTAYFSNYSFPNQLGLNPVFTMMRSMLDDRIDDNKPVVLMDANKAIANVHSYLNIPDSATTPVVRYITADKSPLKANVVVVIMEGMSANYMQRFGQKERMTPFLDSLSHVSYCFNSIYTSGIHTMNGIYSTLFSFPALMHRHPMNGVVIPEYTGLAATLAAKEYQTAYFTTHDDQFDNVGGFLSANGFQKITSQKHYPSDKVLSTLGVADDYMFEFSIPILNELHAKNKPFLAAFMTASNHGPIIIPSYFHSSLSTERQQIIEYSDWALSKFISMARHQSWFDNTIFVFVADHGGIVGNSIYDITLSYNHSPLIIYSPALLSPKEFDNIGGQIDIFPTIMGILGESYRNNTLGIDLLREHRPFMYFSADDKIGCIDNNYLYIYRKNGGETLHNFKQNSPENEINSHSAEAKEMKQYALSMLQTAQWMITNKKTGK
jgi:phosphoglycerol transferase MdoB-like AlkP superfamily enzyme